MLDQSRGKKGHGLTESKFLYGFIYLSLLLIGADLLAVSPAGLTIRFVTLPILLLWLAFPWRGRYRIALDLRLMVGPFILLCAMALSIFWSFSPFRSFAYTLWAVFVFVILVPVFSSFAYHASPDVAHRVLVKAFRCYFFCLLAEFILINLTGFRDRPHLFFYEPSYAAIFLTGYFSSSVYFWLVTGGKSAWDVIFSLSALALLASVTAAFGILLSFLVCFLIVKRTRLKALFLMLVSFFGALLLFQVMEDTRYAMLLVGFLADANTLGDAVLAILERSGTRIVRLLWGWEVIKEHPFVGIGFGADQPYTMVKRVPREAAIFLNIWDDVKGNPFTNPFIEAFATMGVLGAIGMTCVFFTTALMLVSVLKREGAPDHHRGNALIVAFATVFMALQMEGTFLRYYVWALFGLAIGSYSWSARVGKD